MHTAKGSFFRQVLPYLIGVIAFVIAAGFVVIRIFGPDLDQVGLEIMKSFVQVATVLVLGQVLAIIVKDREHERDEHVALNALRSEVLVKLSSAFVRVKGSRRLLRAEALTVPWNKTLSPATEVRREEYCQQMRILDGVELELESLWHQLDTTNAAGERLVLVDQVAEMKDYLRELLFQYENRLPQFAPGPSSLPLTRFSDEPQYATLIDFLDASSKSRFKSRFVKPFRNAARTIRTALLGEDAAAG